MLPIENRDVLAFTVIWRPAHEIAGRIIELYARPDYPRELRVAQLSGSPDTSPQLYNPPTRLYQLWVPESQPEVTVMYPNYQDGAHTLVNGLSSLFGFRSLSLRLSSPSAQYPIYEFTFNDGVPQSRMVRVMKDSKWEFFTLGEPLPFEDTQNYDQRTIRKRFGIDLALEYCQKLGVDVSLAAFWRSNNCTTMNLRA